jgi:hypothetical protein
MSFASFVPNVGGAVDYHNADASPDGGTNVLIGPGTCAARRGSA